MSDLPNTPKSAALSQTAGVPEGWKLVPVEPTAAMCDAMRISVGDGIAMKPVYRAMLAAAPSASGGESAASLSSNPNPVTPSLSSESAASVSEALATISECADGTLLMTRDRCRRLSEARKALEQALTQQPTASAEHWHGLYRKECRLRQDDAARYGQQIVDLESALTQQRGTGQWEVIVTGWTKADGKTLWLEQDGIPMFRLGAHGDIGTNRAVHLTTHPYRHNTPQTSADAVRELAATWRKRAERKRFVGLKNEALLDEAHADELESLLSGGSHA